MPNFQGDWIWYELVTPDPAASAAFYGDVLGWTTTPTGDGAHYHMNSKDGAGVSGFLTLTDAMRDQGAMAAWLGYIAVGNVNDAAKSIAEAGGMIHMDPWDTPGFGRAALVADVEGTVFYIVTPTNLDDSTAFAKYTPTDGHCAWNELMAKNVATAMAFYADHFGWTSDDAMDMGEMGQYHFLKGADATLGAAMTAPDGMPTGWTFYFRVPDIDAAIATVTAQGGRVLNGPQDIPGGEFVINALDPLGIPFALVGKRS